MIIRFSDFVWPRKGRNRIEFLWINFKCNLLCPIPTISIMLIYFVFQVDVVACLKISRQHRQKSAKIQNHRQNHLQNEITSNHRFDFEKKHFCRSYPYPFMCCDSFKCSTEIILISAPPARIKSQYSFLYCFYDWTLPFSAVKCYTFRNSSSVCPNQFVFLTLETKELLYFWEERYSFEVLGSFAHQSQVINRNYSSLHFQRSLFDISHSITWCCLIKNINQHFLHKLFSLQLITNVTPERMHMAYLK